MNRLPILSVLALAGGIVLAANPASAYKIFVSNEGDNTITVIDSDSMEVVETLAVGQRPRGITITKDGKFILLCASDDDTVQVIDAATYEIVGTLPSGPDPELFVLHPSSPWSTWRSARWLPRCRSASSRRGWASRRTARSW